MIRSRTVYWAACDACGRALSRDQPTRATAASYARASEAGVHAHLCDEDRRRWLETDAELIERFGAPAQLVSLRGSVTLGGGSDGCPVCRQPKLAGVCTDPDCGYIDH